jgi:uncharacterized membrane protein YcaP (DUF421 family)
MFMKWLGFVFSHPDLAGMALIAGKTAVVYLFVILGLRLLGKRELGQMSIYDLVLIILIANSVQNAMLGHDTTLGGGIVAGATLLLLNWLLTSLILRSQKAHHWLIGEPVLIARDGKLLWEQMHKEGITQEHLLAAMREHGIGQVSQVQMAVLETDGTISIVPQSASVQRSTRRFRGIRVEQ